MVLLEGVFPLGAGLAFLAGRAFFASLVEGFLLALVVDLARPFGLDRAFGRDLLRAFVRAFGFDPRLAADFLMFLGLRDLDLLAGRFLAMEDSSLETSRTALR